MSFHPVSQSEPEHQHEHEIAGQCPHCRAVVAYEDWIALVGEFDVMGCPCCRRACQVNEVFPLLPDRI